MIRSQLSASHRFPAAFPVGGVLDGETFLAQAPNNEVGKIRLVFDDQYANAHLATVPADRKRKIRQNKFKLIDRRCTTCFSAFSGAHAGMNRERPARKTLRRLDLNASTAADHLQSCHGRASVSGPARLPNWLKVEWRKTSRHDDHRRWAGCAGRMFWFGCALCEFITCDCILAQGMVLMMRARLFMLAPSLVILAVMTARGDDQSASDGGDQSGQPAGGCVNVRRYPEIRECPAG